MNVRELNEEQILELKWTMVWDVEHQWTDKDYACVDDVTDDDVYKTFDHISFVEEDFSC